MSEFQATMQRLAVAALRNVDHREAIGKALASDEALAIGDEMQAALFPGELNTLYAALRDRLAELMDEAVKQAIAELKITVKPFDDPSLAPPDDYQTLTPADDAGPFLPPPQDWTPDHG